MTFAGTMNNPISVLFEYCGDRGICRPTFNQVSVSGQSHNPVFVIEADIPTLNLTARGTGTSKQKAKTVAAQELITKLSEVKLPHLNSNDVASKDDSIAICSQPVIRSKTTESFTFNSVGRLQEMCIDRKWPPPFYADSNTDGPPHLRTFMVSCMMSNMSTTGSGNTKKLAKHDAAQKMLERMENMAVNEHVIHDAFDSSRNHVLPSLLDSRRQAIANVRENSIRNEINYDEEVDGELKQEVSENEAEEKLDSLVLSTGLEVTYVEIKKKSFKGLYQYLVKLKLDPVAVCFGSGSTKAFAKRSAAYDALLYLDFIEYN